MVGIFLSGFSATSLGENPGTRQMTEDTNDNRDGIKDIIPGKAIPLKHYQHGKAINKIKSALSKDPCEPVVIIGHSWGADSAIEIAQELEDDGICVDLLIQIDSIGIGDEKLPDNVKKGVNIWSTSRDGLNGADNVEGSENIGIDNTTHTNIDDDPDSPNSRAGSSSDPNHTGKNAWGLVKEFIGNLSKHGCNCKEKR